MNLKPVTELVVYIRLFTVPLRIVIIPQASDPEEPQQPGSVPLQAIYGPRDAF